MMCFSEEELIIAGAAQGTRHGALVFNIWCKNILFLYEDLQFTLCFYIVEEVFDRLKSPPQLFQTGSTVLIPLIPLIIIASYLN